MIEYQIVLKYKSDEREEEVGRTYNREEATNLRDYYNEQEDNLNIYYLVKSVVVNQPYAKPKRKYWR